MQEFCKAPVHDIYSMWTLWVRQGSRMAVECGYEDTKTENTYGYEYV